MAQNKNIIYVYRDWGNIFNILEDEEAGKLIKHFFSYINDENPVLKDRVLKISWIPIESQLKRDLKKWEKSAEEKSLGGRYGNLKRWNTDLYDKVKNNEIDLEEAEKIAEHRRTSHSDLSESQNIAEIAVKVTDKDTVKVTDKDTVKDIYYKEGGVGDFLVDWNNLRTEILKKPSNVKSLGTMSIPTFNEIRKKYTILEFQNALRGLFKQTDIPKSVMTTNPKHFLENIDTFLQAFYDDNYGLYLSDKKTSTTKSNKEYSGSR